MIETGETQLNRFRCTGIIPGTHLIPVLQNLCKADSTKLGFIAWYALILATPGVGRHQWDTSIHDAMRFAQVRQGASPHEERRW